MLDQGNVLEFLQENRTVHRGIEPNNIAVLSLDEILTVNRNRIDLRSSQNVNTQKTNTTKTKSVRHISLPVRQISPCQS